MTKREEIISIATKELGYKESPPNSNENKYGEWYGLNKVAWCAIFVSWVYDQAGVPLGHVDTDKGFQYCPSALNFWKKKDKITVRPAPADIVLFDWDGDNRSDHTGIFVRWIDKEKTKFECLEGNTSPSNNSNGGEVMLRVRKISQVAAFVNPLNIAYP